ncbi:DUF1385 domain-containing protein [Candidatus Peregrinibacteria bacterium]|nr:DUF1385 domain-containing protein [Candidatus Peregrinibacteria bacterium]
MMRSPNNITIAVRKPNGETTVKKNKYQTLTQRYKMLNIPILRGVINLFEMMYIGTKAINFSASVALDETPEEEEKKKPSTFSKIAEGLMFALSFILALMLSIFLFKFIPLWSTTYLEGNIGLIKENYIIFNLIDGILKMLIFLAYIFVLTKFPSFKRIFEYHGAEHKSIFTYEKKKGLTVDNAKEQSRFHPRCGTSFVLIVFAISILVYTFVPKQDNFWLNLAVRLAFLPLIAGISYEYLKLSAAYAKKGFVKALIAPGLWFQRLTTAEPDRRQLEVGLKSLQTALEMEKA